MRIARRLALGRLVSLSGGSAAYIALVAAIYGETGSALWVSAAIFSSVVASVASAPLAGWIGDRHDRRRVLIASDIAAAAVALAMAATAHHAAALVVLFGLLSIAQAPFDPASAAALPNLVDDADIPKANSLVAMTSSLAYLAGPLAGGASLGLGASATELFAIDAVSFVVSGLVVVTIRQPFGKGSVADHPGVFAGFKVIAGDRLLRVLVTASMFSLIGVGIVDVASYPLALHLHGGKPGYGAMTALLGGGGLLGAALAGRRFGFARTTTIAIAFGAGSAGLAIASAAPIFALALVGMAVAGLGRGLGDVTATTLIQTGTANDVRSRVFAAHDGSQHVAFSVSAFSGGAIVQLAGPRQAFAIAAAFGGVAALIAVRLRQTCSRPSSGVI